MLLPLSQQAAAAPLAAFTWGKGGSYGGCGGLGGRRGGGLGRRQGGRGRSSGDDKEGEGGSSDDGEGDEASVDAAVDIVAESKPKEGDKGRGEALRAPLLWGLSDFDSQRPRQETETLDSQVELAREGTAG